MSVSALSPTNTIVSSTNSHEVSDLKLLANIESAHAQQLQLLASMTQTGSVIDVSA